MAKKKIEIQPVPDSEPIKAKDDYDRLFTYFKFLVKIIGISLSVLGFVIGTVAAVAIYFTADNIKTLTDQTKASINSITNESTQNINKINNRVDSSWTYYQTTLQRIEKEANDAVNETKEKSRLEIEESENLAINAATHTIETFFKEPKLNELMEKVGEKQFAEFTDYRLKNMVSDANNIITNQLKLVPDLILCTDLIRAGSRKAYEHLDSISKYTPDSLIKQLAKNIIVEKEKQYQQNADYFFNYYIYDTLNNDFSKNSIVQYLNIDNIKDSSEIVKLLVKNLEIHYPINNRFEIMYNICKYLRNPIIKRDQLVQIINQSNDLNIIAFAFRYLQEENYNLTMFDFEGIRNLESKPRGASTEAGRANKIKYQPQN